MKNSEGQGTIINTIRTMSMDEYIVQKPNVIINDEKNYRETI